jgi:hypothetical protein
MNENVPMTEREVAEYLKVTPDIIKQWRFSEGLRPRKLLSRRGRHLEYYFHEDVDKWLDEKFTKEGV